MSFMDLNALIKKTAKNRHLVVALSAAGIFALFVAIAGPRSSENSTQALSLAAMAAEQTKSSSASGSPIDVGQKAAIEKIVREYLLKNPEILIEMQTSLQAKSEKLEAARMKLAIKSNSKELFHRANSAIGGNPKGDVTIVEFFDYNCGFCKRAFDNVAKLVKQDTNVRVVFKEFPILSKASEEAARVALAARIQGKYWDVHNGLLTARGRANKASALKIAAKLGLDMDKLKKDMVSDEVSGEIAATRALAESMGINGTPHFIVGENVIPGAPGTLLQELNAHISDIRKNGCAVC